MILALAGPASAQSTQVSELWREWATLEEGWRGERQERIRLRRALLRLRAAREAKATADEEARER